MRLSCRFVGSFCPCNLLALLPVGLLVMSYLRFPPPSSPCPSLSLLSLVSASTAFTPRRSLRTGAFPVFVPVRSSLRVVWYFWVVCNISLRLSAICLAFFLASPPPARNLFTAACLTSPFLSYSIGCFLSLLVRLVVLVSLLFLLELFYLLRPWHFRSACSYPFRNCEVWLPAFFASCFLPTLAAPLTWFYWSGAFIAHVRPDCRLDLSLLSLSFAFTLGGPPAASSFRSLGFLSSRVSHWPSHGLAAPWGCFALFCPNCYAM